MSNVPNNLKKQVRLSGLRSVEGNWQVEELGIVGKGTGKTGEDWNARKTNIKKDKIDVEKAFMVYRNKEIEIEKKGVENILVTKNG